MENEHLVAPCECDVCLPVKAGTCKYVFLCELRMCVVFCECAMLADTLKGEVVYVLVSCVSNNPCDRSRRPSDCISEVSKMIAKPQTQMKTSPQIKD